MSVVIPDDILRATKISEDELMLEIAIMLCEQQGMSSGKVCRRTVGESHDPHR
jgi:predicted HTH domain antitoxin